MLKPTILSVCVLASATNTSAQATSPTDESLLFGAVIDGSCDVSTAAYVNESAAGTAVITKFALNTLVGFGLSLLDKTTESLSTVRSASAPGYFYGWNPSNKRWRPLGKCIRFWYGLQRNKGFSLSDINNRYGTGPIGSEAEWASINSRWAELGLVEQPYLYGEIRLASQGTDNLMTMQPVVLFARTLPEAKGWFRKQIKTVVAIDIKVLGVEAAFGTQLLELPHVGDTPILIRGDAATRGLSSGWVTIPAPPTEPPVSPKNSEATPFNALVVFTSNSDGTVLAKTLANEFKSQKEELIAAMAPQSKAQKAEAQQKANEAAFDAIAVVLEAQAALDQAQDKEKLRLELDLRKAKYLADIKLQAAGLLSRYHITGP